MRVNFAHLCDYAANTEAGKLCVMGIFDQIRVVKLPLAYPTLYLAFEIEMESAEVGRDFTSKISIRDQDGGSLFTTDGKLTSDASGRPTPIGKSAKIRLTLCINQLEFRKPGRHEVVIWLQDRLECTLPFEVVVLDNEK